MDDAHVTLILKILPDRLSGEDMIALFLSIMATYGVDPAEQLEMGEVISTFDLADIITSPLH